MKRTLLLVALWVAAISLTAKTTYIPKYRSYIQLVNGTDTISINDSISDVGFTEKSGMFTIRIEHEEVDKEKVKAIKRANRATGWMAFSAALSTVSSALSKNNLQYYIRSKNAEIAWKMAALYNQVATNEQKLKTDVWVDNESDEEIMVNDTERGFLWYIRPRQSIHIEVNNPDVSFLRISDVHSRVVNYAVVVSGSHLKKWDIALENEDFWYVKIYERTYDPDDSFEKLDRYRRISKTNFKENEMTIAEFEAFKAAEKKKNK